MTFVDRLRQGLTIERGPERIRTAVRAFAELCLATRPQDPLSKNSKVKNDGLPFLAF
jgi:hypothetical protein